MQVPQELIQLPWAVADGIMFHEDGTPRPEGKAPRHPVTGAFAKVNDPTTFGAYEQAMASPMPYKGVLLTDNCGLVVIDLDESTDVAVQTLQQQLLSVFDYTYAEVSISKKGIHIWCKGDLPSSAKGNDVELYNHGRFMICTGEAYNRQPIVNAQADLEHLYSLMKATQVERLPLEEFEVEATDNYVINRLCDIDKFNELCNGDYRSYPSQSEADLALLSYLCFASPSNEQVKRIFRATQLGQREKALRNDTYLDYCLRRIRSKELISQPSENAHPTQALAQPIFTQPRACYSEKKACAPGVLGQLAAYMALSNIRPVSEVGLVAAIGLVSGIAGRQYNISGTGVNQYMILLAPTGTGKEGLRSSIDRMMYYMRQQVPVIDEFLGPAVFASGPAIVKYMAEHPSIVSVLGEFGLTLKRLTGKNPSSADITLKQALLDLYQKSGWNDTLRASVYSDKEKNSTPVNAPALSIIGESTQELLLGELTHEMIADGLLPRFVFVEYDGDRPARNPGAFYAPPQQLVEQMNTLAGCVLAMRSQQACCQVQVQGEAQGMLDEFDVYCDEQINKGEDVYKHLWNRAHLKALKLAALCAIADNPSSPVVNPQQAMWAVGFVKQDVEVITKRFQEESVGNEEKQLEYHLRQAVQSWFNLTPETKLGYKVPKKVIEHPQVIPFTYIRRRLRQLKAVNNHRLGTTAAIELVLKDAIQAEILEEIPQLNVWQNYRVRSRMFQVGREY